MPLSPIPDDIEDRLDAFFSQKTWNETEKPRAAAPPPVWRQEAAPPPPAPDHAEPEPPEPERAEPEPPAPPLPATRPDGTLVLSPEFAAPPAADDDEDAVESPPARPPETERRLRIIRPGETPDAQILDAGPADDDEDEEDVPPPPPPLTEAESEALRAAVRRGEAVPADRFVRHFGPDGLQEEMEAVAAYLTLVGGSPRFSRSELLHLLNDLPTAARQGPEIRIRAFGKLLRTGTLVRVDGDKFALAPDVRQVFAADLGLAS
jgi:hypothetical protein